MDRRYSALLLSLFCAEGAEAVTVGNYGGGHNFAAGAFDIDLVGASHSTFYDGTQFHHYDGSQWWLHGGSGWVTSGAAPASILDGNAATLLAPNSETYSGGPLPYLDVQFSSVTVYDWDGPDIALFFLWPQENNHIEVTLNGTTVSYDGLGTSDEVGAKDVLYNGEVYGTEAVPLAMSVLELDLADFGVALWSDAFRIGMEYVSGATIPGAPPPVPVALGLVAAIHTSPLIPGSVGVVAAPVPAAMWLFGSGLLGLVAVSRRRRRG